MSESAIERIGRRLASAFGLGRITASQDTAGKGARLLQVSINEDEQRDQTPDIAHYGFSSRPKPGADAVMVFVGGDRSSGVVVATGDRRVRLVLAEGEVALHTDEGDKIVLKRGRVVEITTLTLRVVAPTIQLQGDVAITGNVTTTGTIVAAGAVTGAGKSLSSHTHSGVNPGVGNSGPPT